MPAGVKGPLRVLSHVKVPGSGGAKSSGDTSAGRPICSGRTISVANRTSKVLSACSMREGRRSCTGGSCACAVAHDKAMRASEMRRRNEEVTADGYGQNASILSINFARTSGWRSPGEDGFSACARQAMPDD
jgi:hypothetical protein